MDKELFRAIINFYITKLSPMLFTDQQGQEWYIDFKYNEERSRVSKKPTVKTTCVVKKAKRNRDNDVARENGELFEVSVTKNVNDPHNKSIARKVALARVLPIAFPNKGDRQLAWQCYLGRCQ